MDVCERCLAGARLKGERYCKDCRKAVLAELRAAGHLTPCPPFTGAWSGIARRGEQRENVLETKRGPEG